MTIIFHEKYYNNLPMDDQHEQH